jgi:uncharacterized protein
MTGPSEAASPLYTRLRRALPPALKARDQVAIAALRAAVAAIDNAQAVEVPSAPGSGGPIAGAVTGLGAGDVPRRELSEDGIAAIVSAELADRPARPPTTSGPARSTPRPASGPGPTCWPPISEPGSSEPR